MKLFDVYPVNDINIEEAKGSHVWDDAGMQYLDMYGGHAVISIGHTHPHWVNAMQEQLSKIAFYSNSVKIPIQQRLANKLAEVSQKKEYQLFLVNSGAEANENALKLASFHTGRKKVVAFSNAFHGRTSLAVAATDNSAIVAPVNETDNITFLPFNNEDALNNYFYQFGHHIAAVIIEPIQGVGGIIEATDSFLKLIRILCDKYQSVFIADEVQSGYGRTGKFFALDHARVNADIYSMAKGMGNGFPVGGILIAPHISPKHGILGTTFGGNHLACAAALAVLEVIENEKLLNNAEAVGNYLMNELRSVKGIDNIRGKGLMIGFDLADELKQLRKILLQRYQVFTGEAKPNTVRLLPALSLSQSLADDFIGRLIAAIDFILKTEIQDSPPCNQTINIK
jgi:acetylornithine/N-succinyldiaminopimelate aminotransferase